MTTPPEARTQHRIAAYITDMNPDRLTVDTTCEIAFALGVPVETFLVGEPA